ncbi:hypothetical protein SO694_00044141 [Aureococcus anophagefferens]|uniref:Uncharacterized protein n=1 Tax=Aureococcus anophagefferens TaxID=44056 RepID=A0ABR1G7V9_AURAN
MYVGPWQEFKAMERARIAEQHASMAQMAQRRGQPPADQNMADELERLRRALELVSGELPPEAAHKVQAPDHVYRLSSPPPDLDISAAVRLAAETVSGRPMSAPPPRELRQRRQAPRAARARRARAGAGGVASGDARARSSASDPGVAVAAASRRLAAKGGYDAGAATRLLRMERQTRLKSTHWKWGDKPPRRRPSAKKAGPLVKAKREIDAMRASYVGGSEAPRQPIALARAPPKPASPRRPQGVVAKFDLSSDQVDAVAKYFGDDDGGGESPPKPWPKSPKTPKAPGKSMSVDELLSWADNLDIDGELAAISPPASARRL